MNVETLKTDEEKQEIVKQIIKQKFIKTLNNPHGLPAWCMDTNWKVSMVRYTTVQMQSRLSKTGFEPEATVKQIMRMRADIPAESIVILAINKKNAIRKFKKIIQKYIDYTKKHATLKAVKPSTPEA